MFLFLFCAWRVGTTFPWEFLLVIEAIITLGWMQTKSLMLNSTLFFLPAVGLSVSAHELELCAVLSRLPYFISTLWLHADHIHVEFCSRRDLISPPLSHRIVAGNKDSHISVSSRFISRLQAFWQCVWYLVFLWFSTHLLTKHASHLTPQSEKWSTH